MGNVYYYFKTKDELVQAAIDANAHDIQTMLASFDRHRTPKARLKALVRALTDQRELAALYGCPQGTLCSELGKRDDDLERAPAILMQLLIDWAEQQFRAMGRRDARDLAVAMISSYQGIIAADKHVPPTRAHGPRGAPPRPLDRLAGLSHRTSQTSRLGWTPGLSPRLPQPRDTPALERLGQARGTDLGRLSHGRRRLRLFRDRPSAGR